LDRGFIEATAKVGQGLFRIGTKGGPVAAAIFWMKARARCRETHDVNVTPQPGTDLTEAQQEDILRRDQRRWIEGAS
jgi:hypothetical protein